MYIAESERGAMEGTVEQVGQWHGFNWELASSAGDPVVDGGGSRELQLDGAPGRKNVLSVRVHCTVLSAEGTARRH